MLVILSAEKNDRASLILAIVDYRNPLFSYSRSGTDFKIVCVGSQNWLLDAWYTNTGFPFCFRGEAFRPRPPRSVFRHCSADFPASRPVNACRAVPPSGSRDDLAMISQAGATSCLRRAFFRLLFLFFSWLRLFFPRRCAW